MKKVLTIVLLFLSAAFMALSQGDNDYQRFLSRVQPVLSKDVEDLSKQDLSVLDDVIKMDVNSFGSENVRLAEKLVRDARSVLSRYDAYIASRNEQSKTLDELDNEAFLREAAEQRGDSLSIENDQLKVLIDDLKAKIVNFEKQEAKLREANRSLQKENAASRDILQKSSNLLSQMYRMLPELSISDMRKGDLPATLVDSIEDVQCNVARLLKENFVVTMEQLRRNQSFMDSAIIYFKDSGRHIPEVVDYKHNADILIERLRGSGDDCAIDYSTEIEREINDFIFVIETGQDSSAGFGNFIRENIAWLAPVLLVLIIGIVFIAVKLSKKKVE